MSYVPVSTFLSARISSFQVCRGRRPRTVVATLWVEGEERISGAHEGQAHVGSVVDSHAEHATGARRHGTGADTAAWRDLRAKKLSDRRETQRRQ